MSTPGSDPTDLTTDGPTNQGSRESAFSRASAESADRLVRMLAGRWVLAVLGELAKGGRRYQDIHDAIDGIAHKVC